MLRFLRCYLLTVRFKSLRKSDLNYSLHSLSVYIVMRYASPLLFRPYQIMRYQFSACIIVNSDFLYDCNMVLFHSSELQTILRFRQFTAFLIFSGTMKL